MKKISIFIVGLISYASAMAQGAHDFKINEVYIANPAAPELVGYQDEYGEVGSWIEIMNTSYTTHDIRSCFLTNNPATLDESLSAPDRIALMSLIPKGDVRTNLTGKQFVTFFADGKTNRSSLHLNFTLEAGKDNFIALFDGNGVTILDTVTVPANLQPGYSYARIYDEAKKEYVWVQQENAKVTPNNANDGRQVSDKVGEWKEKDPHGIAMAILSMGIVFGCLILLFAFFFTFGWIINRMAKLNRVKAIRKIHESAERLVVIAKEGAETKGIEMENYAAAISLALHEYMGNMHDVESGVLTINHHHSDWENKEHLLRHTPELHHQ